MSHRIGIDDAAWASPWRRRRVGEKVALSLALVLTALLAPSWAATPLVSAAALVAMLALARVRPGLLAAACAIPLLFLLVSAVSVALRVGGDSPAWVRLGPVALDAAGGRQAAGLLGHGVAGTLALLLLATTTPMVDLVTWLRGLRVPPELLDVVALTYRLLFLALSTALAVHAAVVARLGDQPAAMSRRMTTDPGGRAAQGDAAPERSSFSRGLRPAWRRRWQNLAAETSAVALRTGYRAVRMQRGLELRGFESDLATLPVARERSWAFMAGSAVTVGVIWAVSLAVHGGWLA